MDGIPPEYEAKLIHPELMGSEYLQWALPFFVDEAQIADPYLSLSLDLDVTQAYQAFDQSRMGGSFTALLKYCLMQSIGEVACFRYRYHQGQWYVIDNPPLIMPVAVGGSQRFIEMVLPDVLKTDWQTFAMRYAKQLEEIKSADRYSPVINAQIFKFGQFIGNLPNLRFNSFKLHAARGGTQNIFYFGKRARDPQGNLMVPFAMNLHHANADPYVAQHLIDDFERRLLQLCCH